MGDGGFPFIDVVLFAMVAAFLFLRLRGVLGRRTGNERPRPNPYVAPTPDQRTDSVRPLPPSRNDAARAPRAESVTPLATGIAEIKLADPSFNEAGFTAGARAAFEIIVNAYARGELTTLRPLLADDVYEKFAAAIRAREAAGETLETTLSDVRADLLEARMDGRTALVVVKFVSDQINLLRDRAGKLLDGHPAESVEVIDLWTFARDTRSRDPNWALIATRTPN